MAKADQKFKYLNDGDPWMLAEDIPDMDLSMFQIPNDCFVDEFARPGGRAYRKVLCIYRGYHLWYYFGKEDSRRVGEQLVEKFLRQPDFIKKVNQGIIDWSDKLRAYTEKILETNLEQYSNQRLNQIYQKYYQLHKKYYQWGWIPPAVDMFHANYSDRLKVYLRKKGVTEAKVNEYLIILTQSSTKSLIQIEHEEFLKIGIAVQTMPRQVRLCKTLFKKFKEQETAKYGYQTHSLEYERLFEHSVENLEDKFDQKIYQALQKHYQKYFYVAHMWIGKATSFQYYLKELVRLVASFDDLKKIYSVEQQDLRARRKKRKVLIDKLKIREPWLSMFDGFGDFMVSKIYRRFAQIYGVYKIEFILREFSRRLGLTLKQTRFLLASEVQAALEQGKVDKATLSERVKLCAVYSEKGVREVYVGEQARKLAHSVKQKIEAVVEIWGQVGCVGKAVGEVKKIFRPEDMGKMKQGDILVSIATDPDIVPAMKKAAAIVTEQGGITSHAAIVSRELNIPCVIGTKIATQVLQDGDRVEVDAYKGVVRMLK